MADIVTLEDGLEEVSKLLESYIQSGNLNFLFGSGASMPAIQLAGNIEAEINAMLEAGEIAEADLKALTFIEEIEDKDTRLVIGIEDAETKQTLSAYIDFLEVLDELLFERKNILLPRQANIFTTNYDTFFEHAASELPALILNDGFDRTSAVRTNFPFAPERYFDRTYRSGAIYNRQAEVPTVNLVKVHGSLTWNKLSSGISFRVKYPDVLSEEQKQDESQVEDALRKRGLILPNLKKFESTLMDRVYYDLLRVFSNALDRDNALLITFGFSFADEHILDITKRALRNPTAQLIIFSYSEESADDFEEKFSKHRNVKIISPQDGENIDFSRLNSLLREIIPSQVVGHD